jgi:type I site-specific restriction endonuclease
MDRGAVSTMDIKCLLLTYPEETRKNSTKLSYQEEVDYLVTHPERLKFVSNLAKSLSGNTLILVNYIDKHGQPLYDEIKNKVGENRKVFFMHGGVDGEDRNDIKNVIEKENDAIIVGSFGVISTGVSIKRLHNVIFASPSKSQIRVLQSLGRGLRLGSDKTHCVLYDIGDDLSWKKHKNYTLLHSIERIKMYMQQQFNYKLIKVNIK